MSIKNYIWYEEFRPKSIEDMALPVAHNESFCQYIKSGEIPHLLFYGPAGSGKTTAALILMDSIPCTTLKLNGSSKDRGVETMKGKVKTFAGSSSLEKKLKIVFIDEFDGTTTDAQRALKNTIEHYASQCRFLFTCNEIDRIDPAIISRCIRYEFSAFPQDNLIQYLCGILDRKQVKYEIASIQTIIDQFYPDIRSIVNNLQLCSSSGKLDPDSISSISVDTNAVLDAVLDGEVGKLRALISGLTNFNFLYRFLFDILLGAEDLNPEEKKECVEVLSEHLYRDALVANREINFVACAVGLMGALKCKKINFLIS